MKAPDKIRVSQDSDGFWTCREAVSGSQQYVREDIVADLLEATSELVEQWNAFEASSGNMEEAYYKLAKYARPSWMKAIAAIAKATGSAA